MFSRSCGSSPWLMPLHEQQFPDVVSRVLSDKCVEDIRIVFHSLIYCHSGKDYLSKSSRELMQSFASLPNEFLEKYYDTDPHYLNSSTSHMGGLPPVLSRPPVQNLWVIFGVNVPTEVSYYFKVVD